MHLVSSLAFGTWSSLFVVVVARVTYVATHEQGVPGVAWIGVVAALSLHSWSSWAWLRLPRRSLRVVLSAAAYFIGTLLVLIVIPNAYRSTGMLSALVGAGVLWMPFVGVFTWQVIRARRAGQEPPPKEALAPAPGHGEDQG